MEPDSTHKKQTVLVVDDERYVLESLLLLLSAHEYKVVTADNAEAALDKLRDTDVDIVLTDIRMPGMDGIELAGKIHNLEPEMPVLIMTAYAELEVAVGAIKRGAFDFIIKPFNSDYLTHSIRKAGTFREMKNLERNYKNTLEAEVRNKTKELSDLNREIIHRLTVVAEYKDEDTASHIKRVSYYCALIAKNIGWSEKDVETIFYASPMHDIGKIGIPSDILLNLQFPVACYRVTLCFPLPLRERVRVRGKKMPFFSPFP